MSITVRVAKGIADHFHIRRSEWGMGVAAGGWAIVMLLQPNVFSTSRSFSGAASMMPEFAWGIFAFLILWLRIIGLGINGTFKDKFKYSPQFRLAASLAGFLFWSQLFISFCLSVYFDGGAGTTVVMYGVATLFEAFNIVQAESDRKSLSSRK